MDLSDGHAMMHWENKNKNQSSEREEHWKSIKIDCVLAAGFLFSLSISINCFNCINFIVRFESLTRQIQWTSQCLLAIIAFFLKNPQCLSTIHADSLVHYPFGILFHPQLNFHLSLHVMLGC
jgi:hypothetical protein